MSGHMNFERRVSKLEAGHDGSGNVIVIAMLVDEENDAAIRRHFGDQEPPKNALIVLIRKFSRQAA